MKPPICRLCNKDFRSEYFHTCSGGALVQFADYKPLADGATGHPYGLEWFCSAHLNAAQALANLQLVDALLALKEQFGEFPPYENKPLRDPELWVTDTGPNFAKVFGIVREAKNLTPASTKALLSEGAFKVTSGWPSQFESWQHALIEVGATVEIRFP